MRVLRMSVFCEKDVDFPSPHCSYVSVATQLHEGIYEPNDYPL